MTMPEHISTESANFLLSEQCCAHRLASALIHRSLKFDPEITPIASKPKAHNVITYVMTP